MNLTATSRWTSVLVLAAIAGCRAESDPDRMAVGDSAGVVLIDHGPELPAGIEYWGIETTPVLDIGKAEGEDAFLLSSIVHAAILPQGEVVVAERDTRDFRIFDSTGQLVGRFGRKGSGPGEFQTLAWIGVDPSGAIAAYDLSLRRLSRFSADGKLQADLSLRSLPVGAVLGQFADGSILTRRFLLPSEEHLESLSVGLVRDSLELSLISPDGSSSTPVGHLPGSQSVRAVVNKSIAVDQAPFGLRTIVVIADTVFYVSTQESWEIRAYLKDGRLQRILRRRVGPAPITDTARAAWKRRHDDRLERLRAGPSAPPEVWAVAEYSTLPKSFPAHGDLRVDGLGNLWVEDYRPFPREDTLTTWLVLNPEGAILATAELPNVPITEIGTDRVVGVWRDEDDVPHVRVYRLVKHRP